MVSDKVGSVAVPVAVGMVKVSVAVRVILSVEVGSVNVSVAVAEVVQLGRTTAFMASKLFQDKALVATSTSTVKLIKSFTGCVR